MRAGKKCPAPWDLTRNFFVEAGLTTGRSPKRRQRSGSHGLQSLRRAGFWHAACSGRPASRNRRRMRVDRVAYLGWLRTPARARSGRAPFWILVAVTATGTLAMHILVPVLPLAAADFDVSRGTIQLAITLYLFGIAGGQLLYGPVSDKFGRRPTLLVSLGLYVLASAAAGQAAKRMALLTMVQSLAPGIGPAVGGFLGAWFGWRSIFVALVALGVVTLGGVWLALPETAASRGIADSGRMLGSYLALRVPALFEATCSAAPLPAPASTPI